MPIKFSELLHGIEQLILISDLNENGMQNYHDYRNCAIFGKAKFKLNLTENSTLCQPLDLA